MCSRTALHATMALAVAWLAGCGGSSSSRVPNTMPGPGDAFVYTANAGGDNISAFANDSSGALTAVPGSSFPSPGNPFGIAVTPNGKFLYVSSFQNNLVIGFSINATNGAVTTLSCSAFAKTGLQPSKIAITPSGSFLYTADQGGSDVTVFSLDPITGCLTFLQFAVTDSTPRALTIDRTGQFLYVVTGGNGIDAYSITSNGTLQRQTASGFNSGSTTMVSVAASPTSDLLLSSDAGSINALHVLTIAPSTGALTPVTHSPFLTAGTDPSGIAFNSAGTFVFVANSGSNTVSAFSVGTRGALTVVASSPFGTNTGPVDLAVDPSGKFLYVANNGTSSVAMFSISSGVLAGIGTITTGSGPESIAVVGHP